MAAFLKFSHQILQPLTFPSSHLMESSKVGSNETDDEYEELLKTLPKERNLTSGYTFCCYQGLWITEFILKNIVLFQKQFAALDSDLLLASCPKSGTTWLKALSFSIVNRSRFSLAETPLHIENPHGLVLNLEFNVYDKPDPIASLNNMTSPRLLCTHISYSALPNSVKNSDCKIVYVYRNAMDQFVSSWHFFSQFLDEDEKSDSVTDESLDQFCRGVHLFGPFWDHVLEFWKASLEKPNKILLIKYEDLKKDTVFHVKRLAEFIGFPFSEDEEKQGVVEEIVKFCSIENMKTLQGNIHGQRPSGIKNNTYFRKGEVGDWMNHLTPSMADRLKKLVREKFESSSLQMF